MCGIIGYVGEREVVPILIQGLRSLEYRGYDSAGIALLQNGSLLRHRSPGKIEELAKSVKGLKIHSTTGIGHTRWATHGRPVEENAHPHTDCHAKIAVIHNGIIENYVALRESLKKKGHRFTSETDTEVIAHLIEDYLPPSSTLPLKGGGVGGGGLAEAVRRTCELLEGSFALAVIQMGTYEIVAARRGSPLIVGLGKGEFFLASDIPAILPHTKRMIPLDDEEMVVLEQTGYTITTMKGKPVKKTPMIIQWDPVMAEKGGFKHFMVKEIHEQPRAIEDTIRGRLIANEVRLDQIHVTRNQWKDCSRVLMSACGTAWHAALVGKYLFEQLARVSVDVEVGSEFRYRQPIFDPAMIGVAVSQSGETADTLAAVREIKKHGVKVISICNVLGSTLTREADGLLNTNAGPEIGVASTKAFTSQITALTLLALHAGLQRGVISDKTYASHRDDLLKVPQMLEKWITKHDSPIKGLSSKYFQARDMLFIGRGINYPIALEGALKLKEISYIHAEGYAAGELKHGPIALIDKKMPVVAIAPRSSATYEKMCSNIEEVRARDGLLIAVVSEGDRLLKKTADDVIEIPSVPEWLSPIFTVVPLQLLAYHIAVRRGCDVDQPRNLAKSVTVE